jgi:hypothetical protein
LVPDVRRAAILAVLLASCIDTGGGSTTLVPGVTTLPGSEVASSFDPGDRLGIIGAEQGSEPRLVTTPGGANDGPVLEPTQSGLEAIGTALEVDGVVWERIRLSADEGYVPRAMLAFIGEPEDVTRLYEGVTAGTVEDLGAEIAAEIEATRQVLVAQPGPEEVIYDVVGMEDDSVAGFRVRVVATAADTVHEPELVERTPLCSRGVTAEGLCL